MPADDHVTDLIPAFALGSLEPDVRRSVAGHMAVCTLCRADLDAFEVTVDQLSLLAPAHEPPAELKSRLLACIQPEPVLQPRQSRSRDASPLLRRAFALPLWRLAVVGLILLLSISNLLLWQRLQETTPVGPALQVVSLTGTEAAPAAEGMIVISDSGDSGTMIVDGLGSLDDAHQYQLWLIHDGQRADGGVFGVNQDGYHSMWIRAPRPLTEYTSFGITIEPAGGSQGPTGNKVLGSTP